MRVHLANEERIVRQFIKYLHRYDLLSFFETCHTIQAIVAFYDHMYSKREMK